MPVGKVSPSGDISLKYPISAFHAGHFGTSYNLLAHLEAEIFKFVHLGMPTGQDVAQRAQNVKRT